MTFPYRSLIRLYARGRSADFADEILEVFRQAEGESKNGDLSRRAGFYVKEFFALTAGIVREQLRCPHAPKIRKFREVSAEMEHPRCFPRTAIAFKILALAVIVFTIAKGEGLAHYFFQIYAAGTQNIVNPQHHPLASWAANYGLLSSIGIWFLVAWVAGTAVWATRYLVGRAPVQRFDTSQTWPQPHV